MKKNKLLLLAALALVVVAFFAFDLARFFSLDYIKGAQAEFAALYARQPVAVIAGFFAVYVAVTALSLPGAAIMTLLGGAVFGLVVGTVIVSFASSIGATLAMLFARYVLRDSVKSRFGARLADIDKGVQREGAFYLFTLRLVPVFPFFVINLLMGLTAMKAATFYLVSQIGMLAGTLVYVYAGTQLGQISSLKGIVSPGLAGALVLLGVFPLVAKKVVDAVKARRVYAQWAHKKPRTFDRNMVVIGAGAAGLVTSYIAAAVKAKVTLVESHKMGGDCLNYGCVPSKALIKTATLARQMRHSSDYGIASASFTIDFAQVMERVARVVRDVEPHDSVERYTALGVDVQIGSARILDPWHVQITAEDGKVQVLSTRSIVIATGARPFVPPLPGIDEVGYLTSDTLWGLRELPQRLVVLGGGPIGCELAQAFARLGSAVTQLEMAPRIMIREDEDVSAFAKQALQADGVNVLTSHKALRCEKMGDEKFIVVETGGQEHRIGFDLLLCAVGRVARLQGFGLEELGIYTDPKTQRTVPTDEHLQTVFPNILAAGDVAGPYQFTHTASHQAWYAAVNGLFGQWKKFKADYSVIPWATFIDPEVARVGLNEQEAREKGVAFEVTRYGIDDLDRAIADSAAHGWVKVLTVPGKDKILGVTIVGVHAGDLLAEFVLAMKHGLGLSKILGTIHTYPTWAEANKYAAGEWKRAHQPLALLRWVEKFHAWQRGSLTLRGVPSKAPLGALVAVLVATLVALLPEARADAKAAANVAPLVQGGSIPPPWQVVTLPQQAVPVTRYSAETVDGREALRIQTQGSYGNLVHELPAAEAPKRLRWAWRLQEPNTAVDLRVKAGDDAAVKVCLSFDLPLDRVPFLERQVLKIARARTGQNLPAATLCWAWAAAEAKGALVPNVYSRRVRTIVLRNRDDALATWFEESRDVAADFRRAFGDESAVLPPVSALIVAGDGDNTGAASLAHVSGLRVEP